MFSNDCIDSFTTLLHSLSWREDGRPASETIPANMWSAVRVSCVRQQKTTRSVIVNATEIGGSNVNHVKKSDTYYLNKLAHAPFTQLSIVRIDNCYLTAVPDEIKLNESHTKEMQCLHKTMSFGAASLSFLSNRIFKLSTPFIAFIIFCMRCSYLSDFI